MKSSVVLPETFLKCMSAEDRARVGAGMTADEFLAKGAAKNEQSLQKQIVGLLRLKGIEPLVPIFGRKTRMAKGWPDITFAVRGKVWDGGSESMFETFPCGWEIKHGKGKLTPEQEKMIERLRTKPNCWRIKVIRSVDEAIRELRYMGIT